MYCEATIKVKINCCNQDSAKPIVDGVINYLKEFEDSAIVFVEKPVLLSIDEGGIDCCSCKYYSAEEQILGDWGFGVETMIKHFCDKKGAEIIHPLDVDFCDDYEDGDVE